MRICAWVVVGMTMVGMAQNAALAQMTEIVPQQDTHSSTAQGTSSAPTVLTVSGHNGEVPLLHRNGKWYVEVEGLARVTGATVAFQNNRIVLALPGAAAVATAAAPPPVVVVQHPPVEKGFSREFLRAGVEQMAVIREWRSALENAIRTNNPVDESWVSYYRRVARDRMALTTAAATTESDRKALPLLDNVNGMITQLSDRFLALRSNLTYVDPTSLDNDPLDQKILACAQGMAATAVPGNMFEDVPACH